MANPQLTTAAQAIDRATAQVIGALRDGRDAIEYYVANNLVGGLPPQPDDLVHNEGGSQTRQELVDQLNFLATAAKQFLDEGLAGGKTLLDEDPLDRPQARHAVKKLGL